MKLRDYIKLGFGFYIGYELARNMDDLAAEVYKIVKKRIKDGYC